MFEAQQTARGQANGTSGHGIQCTAFNESNQQQRFFFHFLRTLIAAALFNVVIVGPALIRAVEPQTPEQQFAALQKRFQADQLWMRSQAEKATEEERTTRVGEIAELANDFLKLEAEHRGAAVGISSLFHLVTDASRYSFNPKSPGTEQAHEAVKILTTHYADHSDLDVFFFWMTLNDAKASGAKIFFEKALASPHRHVRGAALLNLAEMSALEATVPTLFDADLRLLVENPQENAADIERFKAYRKPWASVDPDASGREALRLLDQVIEQYADVLETPRTMPGPVLLKIERRPIDALTKQKRRPLGPLSEAVRFELANLALGQPAPELAGPDAFGRELKLSDQRGKVVVIMFSFKGCGPCEEMYPGNRKLLETYRGRPLSFVGVMSDERIDTVKEAVETQKITWPVWWDGPKGSIVTRWNVKSWPAIYVLDHHGIVRYRELRGNHLAQAVAQLVKQAEQTR